MSQLTLQIPETVVEAACDMAARRCVSVEEYLLNVIAEAIDQDRAWEQRVERGKQVTRERFLEILAKAPDVPPIAGDEIEE